MPLPKPGEVDLLVEPFVSTELMLWQGCHCPGPPVGAVDASAGDAGLLGGGGVVVGAVAAGGCIVIGAVVGALVMIMMINTY